MKGNPSRIYRGCSLACDCVPRIRTAIPPSAARDTVTPATRDAKISSIGRPGSFVIASPLTDPAAARVAWLGLAAGAGASAGVVLFPPHAETSATRTNGKTARAARAEFDDMG